MHQANSRRQDTLPRHTHFDVLRLVIAEVSHESVQELASLGLVSRRVYLCTVPYLYQSFTLNLTRASHLRLLQHLINPGSRLAEKLRWLTISGIEKRGAIQLLDLYVLFSRLSHLQRF
jgi:hypothetical protein